MTGRDAMARLVGRRSRDRRLSRKQGARFRPNLEFLERITLLAAQPLANLNLPSEWLIGQRLDFSVSFDNASPTDTGYGPYIDLVLPAGADGNDGLVFSSAAYFGSPLSSNVVGSFPAAPANQLTHPLTGLPVTGPQGSQLVVLRLPFGSFSPVQPPAPLAISATLSSLADVGTPLNVSVRGGFQYGGTPLDDPLTDPPLVGPQVTASVTPQVFTLTKRYVGPEDETATGPNFAREYEITVDIADGQTITGLSLSDALSSNLQFVSVLETSIRGTPTATTALSTPSTSVPGGLLTRQFASVTGTTAANDATMRFRFFTPRDNAIGQPVINPTTGDDALSIDDARAQGTWTPVDPRDTAVTVTSDARPDDHTLVDKSIAIQKSVAVVNDTGSVGPTPGDTLQYTLTFQVSDYFAFENLRITDLISDGQRWQSSFTPTLTLTEHGSTTSGSMSGSHFLFTADSPGTGRTTATFDVSGELVSRGLDGQVLGGAVPAGGTGGPPAPSVPSFGGTTATLVYRTTIQQAFSDDYPSGDPSVDEGDTLTNTVSVSGDLINVANLSQSGQAEQDGSSATVTIISGNFTKSLYAINGNTSVVSVKVAAGDSVTYRLRYSLPASDVEPLTILDYLPLPIFNATTVVGFDDMVSASTPMAGRAKFGPADTFRALSGLVPTLSTDATSNYVSFAYPAFDTSSDAASVIDLLFTVTVGSTPFADGLFLTNQGHVIRGTTNAGYLTSDSIVQIELTEPVLAITKGVVATDASPVTFTPTSVGPVSFSAPGLPGYRGSGPITSNGLAMSPINSGLAGVDAGDLITFAIVVENKGSGLRGAFDVRLRDALPSGFIMSAGGLNLNVSDGTGAPIAFSDLGGGLFGMGIELADPGPTASPGGAVDPFDATSGRNIVVITYDLQVASSAAVRASIANTATLFHYGNSEGGGDFTTVDLTDDAQVRIAAPAVVKSITAITPGLAGNLTRASIGERVTYQVIVTIPEGTTPLARLIDTLDAGLAFVEINSILASNALNTSLGTFNDVRSAAVYSNFGGGTANNGRRCTLDFGTITNTDTNDGVAETITLTYTVVVINGGSNDRGDSRNNSAAFSDGSGTTTASAANVTIAEPTLQVAKSVSTATGDAGDVLTFTLVLTHAGTSNAGAYDVILSDMIPAGMTYVGGSLTHTAGLAPGSLGESGGTITVNFAGFPLGSTSTLRFQASVNLAATIGQAITNTARITYTSLPGDVRTPLSTHNTLSTERTGSTTDPGGNVNDYSGTGTATFTLRDSAISKSIGNTNQVSTAGNNVAIGEIITYRVVLTIPEGTAPGAVFTDSLDTGLALVSLMSITASPGLSTSVMGGFPGVLAGGVVGSGGSSFALDFGTLTNSDIDDGVTETIELLYNVAVLNTSGNNRGIGLNNSAEFRFSGRSVTASASNVVIVEPELQVMKSGSIASGDAGDVVTFTLDLSHTGSSNADAFDLVLSDLVPSGFTYVAGSLMAIAGLAPSTINDALAPLLSVAYAVFPQGSTSRVRFQAVVDSTVQPGQLIRNTASVVSTSLPGDVRMPQSSFAGLSTERTGTPTDPGGSANDLTDTDFADFTASVLAPVKTIVATSEAHTGNLAGVEQLVIGEIVRYRLTTRITEGTIPNLQFVDQLPQGLLLLDPGMVKVSFLADTDVTEASDLAGADNDAVFSSFVLPANRISTVLSGGRQTLTFSLGTLVNNDSDVNSELVTLEFNAFVVNTVSGSNDAGDQRDNSSVVLVNSSQSGLASNVIDAVIVEPSIVDLSKSVDFTRGDAGDLLNYTVTYTNTGTATAFDVRLLDVLPASLVLGLPSVAVSLGGGSAGVTDASTSNTVEVTIGSVPVGGTVRVVYQATVDLSAVAGSSVMNAASLTYTSLPGAGTASNGTGSQTPGATGAGDSERDGSGGINDYADQSESTFTLSTGTAVKSIRSTNLNDSMGQDVAIGEQVTYEVTLTITEGTTLAALLTDTLPAGLALVDLDSITSSAGLNTSVVGGFDGVLADARAALPAGGGSLLLDFGTITNADTDNGKVETIVVAYTAVVLNTAGNQAGSTLTNGANFSTNNIAIDTSAPSLATVEPELFVTKTVSTATGDAGGSPITFTLVVSHTMASTFHAFDVTLTDVLPSEFSYVPGSFTYVSGVLPDLIEDTALPLLRVSYNKIALGGSSVVSFQALINGAGLPGDSLTNQVDLSYSSLPGDVTSAQSTLNSASTERTGNTADPGGTLNNYSDHDTATVTLNTNSLSGFVYADASNDGVRDLGERAIAGVTITLTGTDNLGAQVTLIAVTDIAGFYELIGLRPGYYTITETQPGAYLDGHDTIGTQNGVTLPDAFQVTLPAGASTHGVENNFGEVEQASLEGSVYVDVNNNGMREPGEPGIAGVEILLTGVNDLGEAVSTTVMTHSDGSFAFNGMRPGLYRINESQPSLYIDGIDTIGTLGGMTADDEFSGVVVDQLSAGTLYLFGERATADLSLIKAVSDSTPDLGDQVTFTLTLINHGPVDATSVSVLDTWPAGLDFASALASHGSYDEHSFTWTVDTLLSGQVALLSIVATVSTVQPVTNVAQLNSCDQVDIDSAPGNNVATEDDQSAVTLTPQIADLSLVKTVDSVSPRVGDIATFTLLLVNAGPNDATNVSVVDQLPEGLEFVSAVPSQGQYNAADGVWNVSLLPSLESRALLIRARVTTTGIKVNSAQVATADQFDPDSSTGNNVPGEDDQDSVVLVPPASLTGSVFIDMNGDNTKQANEVGIAGVLVILTGTDYLGRPFLRTTSTGSDGQYLFDGLPPGTYQIAETQPAAYLDAGEHLGTAGGSASDDLFTAVTLAAGEIGVSYDFGEVGGSISGSVFLDTNRDAHRQTDEPGISGVTITLTGTDLAGNPIIRAMITGEQGEYYFGGLPAGTYTIGETQPDSYLDGGDSAGSAGGTVSNDRIGSIALGAGQNAVGNSFGEVLKSSIAGFVYYDLNHDRTRTEGLDLGIAGVLITLTGTDQAGAAVSLTTTTDAEGAYRFEGLQPGLYTLSETQPSFFRDYAETVGTLGGFLAANDRIDGIGVEAGDDGQSYNFGELQPAGCNLRNLVLKLDRNRTTLAAKREMNPARFDHYHPQYAPAFGAPARGIYQTIYSLLPTLRTRSTSTRIRPLSLRQVSATKLPPSHSISIAGPNGVTRNQGLVAGVARETAIAGRRLTSIAWPKGPRSAF